ncbi:MAG: hypothetical protein QOI55_1830 [Actinomycetota bacterium]|nr:hypothetical protein [Actinomycetota bacterium]
MTTSQPTAGSTSGWRAGVARRLQHLAGALDDHAALPVPAGGEAGLGAALARQVEDPAESHEEFVRRRLRSVIEELYPTVAPRVLTLAEEGADADVDEWVTVARLLYDAHMHRVGGPSIEARQRALLATLGQALEAQARSSARLAGYGDDELDRPSTLDGDSAGTLLWEHYLCPEARLARGVLHGESVGDWLGALGELWSATDALYGLVANDDAPGEEDADDEVTDALDRTKVALVRVQELSLW